LLRLVLSFGAGAGWVRHRTHSILPVIALHVCLDMSLFIAAIALSSRGSGANVTGAEYRAH
jgi:membrane protease YdiL (CAAX protease family)